MAGVRGMKHGEEINFWHDDDDPEMWFGLAMPMDVYLARECRCEVYCECEDESSLGQPRQPQRREP